MPWYRFELSSQQLSAGAGSRVLNEFETVFIKLGSPVDMAMFIEDSTLYLSPATEQRAPYLLQTFRAQPGGAPPDQATLMAGRTGSRPSDFT